MLPKNRSRSIKFKGHVFRWMVGTVGPHGLANLVIENATGDLVYCEPTLVVSNDGTHKPVTPAEVRDILAGLRLSIPAPSS